MDIKELRRSFANSLREKGGDPDEKKHTLYGRRYSDINLIAQVNSDTMLGRELLRAYETSLSVQAAMGYDPFSAIPEA